MDEPTLPAIQLKVLIEALKVAEDEHRPQLSLREDFNHTPTECSCGVEFGQAGWDGARAHLHEMMARSAIKALHRPCDNCLGAGVWHRSQGDFICAECDGRGQTLTPLPAMTFQDQGGQAWIVDGFETTNPAAVWARVHKDE